MLTLLGCDLALIWKTQFQCLAERNMICFVPRVSKEVVGQISEMFRKVKCKQISIPKRWSLRKQEINRRRPSLSSVCSLLASSVALSNKNGTCTHLISVINCIFFSLNLVFQEFFQNINIPLFSILIIQNYGIFLLIKVSSPLLCLSFVHVHNWPLFLRDLQMTLAFVLLMT